MKNKRLILILILVCFFAFSSYLILTKPLKEHYNEEVLKNVNSELKEKLEKNDYSKTLEEMLINNKFQEDYYAEYLNIDYIEKDNFLDNVNNFLNKGYTSYEINNMYKNLSDTNILKLTNLAYESLDDYYNIINFDANNYQRYNNYKQNNTYELKDIVTYINSSVDMPTYTNTSKVENTDSYLILINKFHYLDKDYKPSDLVSMTGYYGNVYMRSIVKDNFINLKNDLLKELDINIIPTTAYRGYSFQKKLYNNYVKENGTQYADKYSAREGYSEHQTGLAIDLINPKVKNNRLNDLEYTWLKDNAYKYGFIIRYPQGKEFITRYNEENWHLRYVGNEAAKTIHDNNLALEEYIDLYETKY